MPRINVRTNVSISQDKMVVMTNAMKKIVDTIPWEDGKHLLTDFEENRSMLFGENAMQPCATIEFNIFEKVYKQIDEEILENALMCVTKVVGICCDVPEDRIFAFFNPLPMWAWEGVNIEKTIFKT